MNIYTETIQLRSSQCDLYGAWKPSAILECMQETAGAHSARFGLSRDVMNGMGVAWILSRVKVQMNCLPAVGEKIIIETYPTPNRHLFYPRTHVFRDEHGSIAGSANSLWMLMDLEARKVVQHPEVLARVPSDPALKSLLGLPATVRALNGEGTISSLQPVFTDYDTNQHVNNTKYLDWCQNALGMDVLKNQCLAAFDVNYDAEILPGTILTTELKRENDRFTFLGQADGKQHFAISGTLCPRT